MPTPKAAVFLDRDDTLIKNYPYLGDPSKVEILPTVLDGLNKLKAAGFALFIVSNQSGVGRGLITREQVAAVNEEMIRQLGQNFFSDIYNCYSTPEDPYSDDRKPSPKMVLDAAAKHNLDLKKSFMIGNRLSDVQCGKNAGCLSILVPAGPDDGELHDARKEADFVAKDFITACDWILKNSSPETNA